MEVLIMAHVPSVAISTQVMTGIVADVRKM